MDDAGCNAASFRKEHDCGKLERRPRANPFWPPLVSRSDATMVAVGFSPRATTDLDASRSDAGMLRRQFKRRYATRAVGLATVG